MSFTPKQSLIIKLFHYFHDIYSSSLMIKNQNWTPIRSTKGISNFVRFGLSFAIVPNKIISMIKIQQQQTIEKLFNIYSHDSVEIQSGAFKGQQAIFQNYNSNDRVTVLLKLIGQHQETKLMEKEVVAI